MASNSTTNPAPNPMTNTFNDALWNNTTKSSSSTSSAYIGQIIMWGGPDTKASSTLGLSWLLCNGQAVSKTTYASLYAVLGDLYGSTSTTFYLPSFLGSFPIGASDTTNMKITYNGSNVNTGGDLNISTAQMPSHNHSSSSSRIDSVNGGSYAGTVGGDGVRSVNYASNISTNSTGSGQQFLPPFQCINFYIKAL